MRRHLWSWGWSWGWGWGWGWGWLLVVACGSPSPAEPMPSDVPVVEDVADATDATDATDAADVAEAADAEPEPEDPGTPDAGPEPDAGEPDPGTGLPPGITELDVALKFAPIWYQDTANGGPDGLGAKMDVPTRADYDGNLAHDDNWDNLGDFPVEPALYYALVASETHYFLTWSQYHARDWEQVCLGLTGLCHEGDMESVGVVVRRDDTGYGTVELVWSHAHGVDSYWAPDGIGPSKVSIAGWVDFEDETHVRIFSESRGHGLAPCSAQGSPPFGILAVQCVEDDQGFPGGDGIVLVPTSGEAPDYEPGMETAGEPMPYALEPVETTLWAWRDLIGEGQMYRPDGAFEYSGARGEPFALDELLGEQFDPDQFVNDSSSGKPPWVGQMPGSEPSDRFFDPAWAFHEALPVQDWSLVYTYHPYLPGAVGESIGPPDPEPADPDMLTVRFLGVGGFSLRHGGDHALSAPLFTNPSIVDVLGDVAPDPAVIDTFLDPDFVADVAAILVGHAHYDHLLDVPHVWSHTDGARIYGNLTMKNLLAALTPDGPADCADGPPQGVWPELSAEALVALNDPQNDRVDSRLCAELDSCTGPWSGDEGEWVDVPQSDMRVRAVCSMHPDQFLTIHFAPGCAETPWCAPPAKADAWVEGATLAFLVDFLDPETGDVTFRVYYQDAPTNAPIGHVHPDVLAEKRVDLAVLNVGSYNKVENQPTATIEALNPRYVLAGHWEDFFVTQDQPLVPIPFLDLVEYQSRLDAALPDDGTPPLEVNGEPQPIRGLITQPGDQVVIAPE